MADSKLTALTEDTAPTGDDLLYTVNDPSGTPASRKATITNVLLNGAPWAKISETTASSSASVDFTGLSSTYRAYLVVLAHVAPATDAVQLYFRTSTDNGATYDAGAGNYAYAGGVFTDAASSAAFGSTSATFINLSYPSSSLGNAADEHLSGWVLIANPSAAKRCRVTWQVHYERADDNHDMVIGGGTRLATADVDAIRFIMSSGNIASGTFTLYGLKA